jgi:hypothetical protein
MIPCRNDAQIRDERQRRSPPDAPFAETDITLAGRWRAARGQVRGIGSAGASQAIAPISPP